jgi:amino acid adenylation domain-containing protein
MPNSVSLKFSTLSSALVHRLFELQVEQTPHAIAVTQEDKNLTYQHLNERANQLAHYLTKLGVKSGSPVGLYIERSLEMVVAILGILKAGGAYVPLDTFSPQERLAFMLQDAAVPLLLTQQTLLETVPKCEACTICLDTQWNSIAQESRDNLASTSGPDHLAYVIYTSGSTGKPKGVMVEHSELMHYLSWCTSFYIHEHGQGAPLHSSIGFDLTITSLFAPLLVGQRIVLVPEVQDLTALATILRTQGPFSLLKLTPAHLQLLNQQLQPNEFVSCTHNLVIGGEALHAEDLELWRTHAPEIRLINEYGPTEAVVGCCFHVVTHQDPHQGEISIGYAIANTQIYLLDEKLQPVPIGVPGELYIGGAGLARGYLNRPELTASCFIPDPFSNEPGARLYRTGDLACYLPDGTIAYQGRLDHQVKLRGYRIELGEIEAALAEQPQIKQAVILLREDTAGDKRLVAYIVPHKGQTIAMRDLRLYLQRQLPEYMIPAAFVVLEALPLTPNGKIDHLMLPAPKTRDSTIETAIVIPQTRMEKALAKIWATLLGIEQVGIYDNFFELGGHSLQVAQVIARVRENFQVDLSFRSIFEHKTVHSLSQHIEQVQLGKRSVQLPPFQRISRDTMLLPLTFVQEQVWFIQQLDSTNVAWNGRGIVHFTGQLNIDALERSLNEIVRRHEILRTTFPAIDGGPVQIIHPVQTIHLPVLDLQTLPKHLREKSAQEIIDRTLATVFDLPQLPLVRWILLRLSEQKHLLIQVEHHLLHDGWSANVLLYEMLELYKAFSIGKPSPLPELPIQPADFAVWQRQWLQGDVMEKQLAYWKQKLAGSPPVLEIFPYRPRPAVQHYQGEAPRVELPPALCKRLRELSQKEDVTLFMTMFAAFLTLLFRYTKQEDLCIGTTLANRHWPETETLVGLMLNAVVLRTDLSGNPTFRDLLSRVRNVTLEAFAHPDLPLSKIVEALGLRPDLSYQPLFQIMFAFHDAPLPDLELPNLSVKITEAPANGSAKFDLNLTVIPRAEQYLGRKSAADAQTITVLWEYNTGLFDSQTILRLITHYQILLEGIVAHPEQRITDIPMLTQVELYQMLVTWNNSAVVHTSDKCAHQIFELQAGKTPDAVAAIFEDTHLSYHELNCRANQLAYYLRSLGVSLEVCVGVCMERSLEALIAFLAILKAGGVYVPLDPAYPKDRLSFMFSNSQMSILLTKKRWVSNLPQTKAQTICLDTDWEMFAHAPTTDPSTEVGWQHLAYVIYTSGSTGAPKGVMIEHGGMLNHLYAKIADLQLMGADCIAQTASLCFDISIWQLLAALLVGGSVCIVNDEATRDPSQLLPHIGKRNISILEIVPSLLQAVLEEQLHLTRQRPNLSSLRWLLLTGEALSSELCRRWFNIYPDIPLMNAYGPTECSDDVTHHPIVHSPADALYAPIGRPIANTRLYVLDQKMQPVPIEVAGELFVGGAGVSRGYLNDPVRTAEAFIPDPFARHPSARLYKTGDLAYFTPDGELHFLGRVDHQIKLRGFRIELGEIEAILSRHASVREAVVVTREDVRGEKYLAAYVVPHQGKVVTDNDLHTFLKEQLPTYMLPSAYMLLDTLPLTPNGKVDRKALPTQERYSAEHDDSYVEPHTPIEKVLANIWCDILALKRVSIHDTFFEIGGHSLLAFQVIAHVRDTFHIKLPLRSIFEHTTIASLATALTNDQDEMQKLTVVAQQVLASKHLSENRTSSNEEGKT